MHISTHTLRRLKGLGLALAVAAVAAPSAQAVARDYEIESARLHVQAISTYDAIEALRSGSAPQVGSLAYELGRAAEPPAASERLYDAIEVARALPEDVTTRRPYDGIELVRTQPPFEASAPAA